MFSVKHIVAAITLGTAMLMAPGAASAVSLHRTGTPTVHPVSHKKKKHRKVHRKHSTKATALKTHGVKHIAVKTSSKSKTIAVSAKAGTRHHPSM